MVDSNRKDAESTKGILASIKKTMLEESGESPSDKHGAEKPVSSLSSHTSVVEELRQLIDEYTDLPKDLVKAVTQLDLETKTSDEKIGDDLLIELKELSEKSDSDREGENAISEPPLPDAIKQFIEGAVADMGIPVSRGDRELDGILALLFKIIAYRWLDQNLEPLVKKLVHAEIERLAKTL